MAKITKEQKLAQREEADAMEFKAEADRVRAVVVVESDGDLLRQPALEQRFGREMVSALYRVLFEARRLQMEYDRKLAWLKDKLDELQRHSAEKRFYSDTPVQNADDLNATYGQLYATMRSAASLCRAMDVYCPMLVAAFDAALHDKLLRHAVTQETDGLWRVKDGADYVYIPGGDERPLVFDAEWKAWRAVRMLVYGQ